MWLSPWGLLPPSLAPVGASPLWKAPGASYPPPPPPPPARAVSAVQISSSSLLGPVGCCIVWVGGVKFTLWVFFSFFLSHIYSYFCASPESELSHPQSYSTAPVWMASEAPEKGVVLFSAERKGRLGWQVHFAQLVWRQGDVTAQPVGWWEMVHVEPREVLRLKLWGKGLGIFP